MPKAVTFPKKNELPRVGLEPTTLYILDMYMHVYLIYLDSVIVVLCIDVIVCIYSVYTVIVVYVTSHGRQFYTLGWVTGTGGGISLKYE